MGKYTEIIKRSRYVGTVPGDVPKTCYETIAKVASQDNNWLYDLNLIVTET